MLVVMPDDYFAITDGYRRHAFFSPFAIATPPPRDTPCLSVAVFERRLLPRYMAFLNIIAAVMVERCHSAIHCFTLTRAALLPRMRRRLLSIIKRAHRSVVMLVAASPYRCRCCRRLPIFDIRLLRQAPVCRRRLLSYMLFRISP